MKQLRLIVYPIPEEAETLHYRAVRKLDDYDRTGDSSDATQAWFDVLVYGLASRLADEYQLDLNKTMRLEQQFQSAMDRCKGKDHEPVDHLFVYPI